MFVWAIALFILAGIDIGLIVYVIYGWACGDPGWLS
jgi:hypothetical protein